MQQLLEKLHRERGFDFSGYKESTLTRRLSRRLHARGVQTCADYARILDQDSTEYDRLFHDLTIKVTSFFRDPIAFRALEEVALPELTGSGEHRENTSPPHRLRIWSAGCATGEEPYSIAILLRESLGEEINRWDITILSTDIDAQALHRAREGWFASRDVESIRQEWLSRYFAPGGKGFCVQPALKQLVTFQVHNLVSDPPYPDLDLIVCRNVLIYFTPPLQTQVLKGFHQGLKQGGFLLLGKAEEPLGETRSLFHPVDRKAKLFSKPGLPAGLFTVSRHGTRT